MLAPEQLQMFPLETMKSDEVLQEEPIHITKRKSNMLGAGARYTHTLKLCDMHASWITTLICQPIDLESRSNALKTQKVI